MIPKIPTVLLTLAFAVPYAAAQGDPVAADGPPDTDDTPVVEASPASTIDDPVEPEATPGAGNVSDASDVDAPLPYEEDSDASLYLARENFESRFQRVYGPLEDALGSLPEGWSDQSSPGAVVFYEPAYDELIDGDKALRMTVKDPGRDAATLEYGPIPLKKGISIRLGLSLRSPTPSVVTVGMRSSGENPVIYYEQQVPSAPTWTSGDVSMQVTKEDPAARFYVSMDQPGMVEMDLLFVEPYGSRSGSVIPIAVEDSPNLLSTSSFPDGVHAPWALLNADYYETDKVEIGPTGLPTLKFAGEGASLTIPFSGAEPGKFTFSVYLKGSIRDQPFSLILTPPLANPKIYPFHQTITVDREWRRYTTTVPLEVDIDGYYLAHIISHTSEEVWVDGAQVEQGEAMTALARSAPVEIVLQTVNPMGVTFENEPLVARVTVYGALLAASTLKGTVYDHTGNAYPIDPLSIKGTRVVQRLLSLKDLGEPKFGSFRVEMQAFNVDDKPVSRIAEVLIHRIQVPENYNALSPESPFGINLGHLDRSANCVGTARALGFKWVRDARNFSWHSLYPEEESPNFEAADMANAAYKRFKMAVLAVLGPAPPWAVERPANFPLDLPLLPRDPEQWKSAIESVVERYREVIQAWEPWPAAYGERTLSAIRLKEKTDGASGEREVDPVFATAEDYVAMQNAAHEAIHRASATSQVTADLDLTGSRETSGRVIHANIARTTDVLSFHDRSEDAAPLARMKANIAWIHMQEPAPPPLWQSQAIASPSQIFNYYAHVPPFSSGYDPVTDASVIVSYYLNLMASGVERFFVLGFAIDPFKDLWQPGHRIFNVDGRLHPNAVALSHFMRNLEGAQFDRVYKIEDSFDFFTFIRKKGALGVLVNRGSGALRVEAIPDGIAASELFGNLITFPADIGRTPTYFHGEGFSTAQLNYLFKTIAVERVP
jgi:hypothetical protein